VKREKWVQKTGAGGVSDPKKREASATHLAARLARTQTTIAAPLRVASLPKTRTYLAGSLRDAEKAYVARIRQGRDDVYFRETLRSFRPVPYEYVFF
jgi:hypothetical protein